MNNYVLNPKTQRMVKIGGKAWRALVREGVCEEKDPENRLFKADTAEEAKVA